MSRAEELADQLIGLMVSEPEKLPAYPPESWNTPGINSLTIDEFKAALVRNLTLYAEEVRAAAVRECYGLAKENVDLTGEYNSAMKCARAIEKMPLP